MATRGRKSTSYTICGQTRTLNEWAQIANLSINALRYRLSKGWPIEKAIAIPAAEGTSNPGGFEASSEPQVTPEDVVENQAEIPSDAPRNDDVSELNFEDE